LRIVLDTNVLVSGLLNPSGAPGRVLDLILAGEVTLLVDDRVLDEYRGVLRRPKFGFQPGDVADLMIFIEKESERVLASPLGISLPDRGDIPFLEVAVSGSAEALVTGNARHFRPAASLELSIEGPAQFLRRLG
jgi:uncharacterized protein